MDNKNGNKKEAGEAKKELTPEQLRKHKQLLVLPLFFLVFAGAMYLIFAPSGKDKEKQKAGLGYNTELPMPKEEAIISDKKDAYEKEEFERKQQEKRRTLQDLAFVFEDESGQSASQEQFHYGNQDETPSSRIQSSVYAYQDVNRQLGNFYEPVSEKDEEAEQRQLELEWRLQELERKEEERKETRKIAEDQLALMEKSYQMAAKYMPPTGQGQVTEAIQRTEERESAPVSSGNSKSTIIVSQVQEQVVSSLPVQMSDSAFVSEYSKPRNMGFISVTGNKDSEQRNGIFASVYKTVTLSDGQGVQLRLMEEVRAGNHLVPKGTVVSGTVKIGGERTEVFIPSILLDGNIIPVELAAYDLDGRKGISVPGSAEMNALKEMAANMGQNMGTSISITDNAGSQIASDLSKGVIQGASQYLSKKLRTEKVTLKAGHKVLLLSDK